MLVLSGVLLGSIAFCSPALAQGELGVVAVRRISGPEGRSLRNALASGLELVGYSVVGEDELVRAAHEALGPAARPDDDLSAVASHLGLLAFVRGTVARRGRQWRLTLVVHGPDGSRAGSAAFGSRALTGLRSVRTRGPQRLARYFAAAPAPASSTSAEEPTPPSRSADSRRATGPSGGDPNWFGSGGNADRRPRETPSNDDVFVSEYGDEDDEGGYRYDEREAAGDGNHRDRYRPDDDRRHREDDDRRYREDDDYRYDEDDDHRYDEDDEDDAAAEAPFDKLELAVYMGYSRRSMAAQVHVDPRFRAPFQVGPALAESRDYAGGGMELGLSGRIAPGAFLKDPVAPWLQLGVTFRSTVGLATLGNSCSSADEPPGGRVCPAAAVPIEIGTVQREIGANLRVDYRFGDTRRGPFITAEFGVHVFQFLLDLNALAQLTRINIAPPMEYTSIHIGAGVRYGLTDTLWAGLRGAYRPGTRIGTDAMRIWGTETGGAQGLMLGLDLSHEMTYFAKGLMASISFDYLRYSTSFQGLPGCLDQTQAKICDGYHLWEPWPTDDGRTVRANGQAGIVEPVADNYIRIGLNVGYLFY